MHGSHRSEDQSKYEQNREPIRESKHARTMRRIKGDEAQVRVGDAVISFRRDRKNGGRIYVIVSGTSEPISVSVPIKPR